MTLGRMFWVFMRSLGTAEFLFERERDEAMRERPGRRRAGDTPHILRRQRMGVVPSGKDRIL